MYFKSLNESLNHECIFYTRDLENFEIERRLLDSNYNFKKS